MCERFVRFYSWKPRSGGQLQADGVESLDVRFFSADALPPLLERHARRVRDGLAGGKEVIF